MWLQLSNPFCNCQQLESSKVDENNPCFISVDGVLFNKSISKLIACPGVKFSWNIPSSVTSIGDCAFGYCTSLESVIIPFGVISIGIGVFNDCTSLENVVMPASVTEIKNVAFEGYSSLSSISIPVSVTSIGEDSFDECDGLNHVFLPEYLAGQEWKFPRSAYVRIR